MADAEEWSDVGIQPVSFKGCNKVGDFEYMIKDIHHARSLFLIFENIHDMLEKEVAGGGTAVLRPWCFPQAGTPRAAGVPTGWTTAGGFPELTKQVQFAIDLAFERIHTLLHTYNFNLVIYSCDAEDPSKIGTGIFSKSLGQDVIDYISLKVQQINHDIKTKIATGRKFKKLTQIRRQEEDWLGFTSKLVYQNTMMSRAGSGFKRPQVSSLQHPLVRRCIENDRMHPTSSAGASSAGASGAGASSAGASARAGAF